MKHYCENCLEKNNITSLQIYATRYSKFYTGECDCCKTQVHKLFIIKNETKEEEKKEELV